MTAMLLFLALLAGATFLYWVSGRSDGWGADSRDGNDWRGASARRVTRATQEPRGRLQPA